MAPGIMLGKIDVVGLLLMVPAGWCVYETESHTNRYIIHYNVVSAVEEGV